MPGAGDIFDIVEIIFETVAGDIRGDQFDQQLMICFHNSIFLGMQSGNPHKSISAAKKSISEKDKRDGRQNTKHGTPDSIAAVGESLHQILVRDRMRPFGAKRQRQALLFLRSKHLYQYIIKVLLDIDLIHFAVFCKEFFC